MSVYILFEKETAVFTVPRANKIAQPTVAMVGQPSVYQSFACTVTGTGALTASVQPLASNDGINWATYGAAIALTGTATATAVGVTNASFAYWSASMTAISGTGAMCNCLMSA